MAAITAKSAGTITGALTVWLALLAGIMKCWQISRRPTTNRKGALSLMLMLLAFFLPASFSWVTTLGGPSFSHGVPAALTGMGMLGAGMAALVLAFLGLDEISHRPGRYTQGRAQAISTLVFSGLILLTIMVGALVGAGRGARMMVNVQPGQVSRFEDNNFEFRAPGRPWSAMNATNINKAASLAFLRQYPETYFVVVAEKVGTHIDFSTAQYADLCQEHIRAVSGGTMQVLSESPLSLNGLQGRLDRIQAQLAGHSIYYHQWIVVTNGYAYELVAWGASDNQENVAEGAGQMMSRFKQIDPFRVAAGTGKEYTSDFVSPHYHYSVRLADAAWSEPASVEKMFPYAEFAASQGDTELMVVPVWLDGQKISFEALTSALLATLNVEYPNDNLIRHKRTREGDRDEVVYDLTRERGGITLEYRFKIVRATNQACFVAAWTQRKSAPEKVLADALGRVRFEDVPPATSDRTGELSHSEQKTRGYVLNQAGLFYHRAGEYEPALPLFCAAVAARPAEAIYIRNALLAWRNLDRPKEALTFLAEQSTTVRAMPDVRADEAYFQALSSYSEAAISNYADLFGSGFRDDTHFATYVELLNQQRQFDRALTEITNYLQGEDSLSVRLLEAATYRQKKDFTQAISLLQAQREAEPDNAQVASALAETFIQARRYTEGLAISRELLDKNGESARADALRGRSELGLKWYREARQSFEAAARLAPANREILSYRDLVNGLLGEGDNSLVREPVEAIPFPASLTNNPPGAVPTGYATNFGAYYDRRLVALSYTPGKEYKTTEFTLTRVLDSYGVSAFSTVQVMFDPLNEQVYANEIRVLDPEGHTVSLGNVDNYYVLDGRHGAGASQEKILNIPVAGLQPNYQLAVTVTRRRLGPPEKFPFFEHSFAATFPLRESILFLAGDAAGLKYLTSPPLAPTKLPEGLCWRLTEPLTARWEPLQPPVEKFLPFLWLGDATAQWPDIGSNYLASISDRLVPDASVQDLARGLTGSATNDDGKIATLARYVQTNYTYKAIEFGRRARVPNFPAEIINNRYGDCKDHAVLLQQMLTAVGVPAQLVLINSRGRVEENLPSLDQFNHMIVLARGSGGDRFLDCTVKGANVAQDVPYGLAGDQALILDAQHSRLARLPDYPDNASEVTVRQEIRAVDKTDLAVEETMTLRGFAATGMREYLLQVPEDTLKTTLQSQFGAADAPLEAVHVESLHSPEKPLALTFDYTFKKQLRLSAGRLTGTLRAGFARDYLAPTPFTDRKTPFEKIVPLTFHSTVMLHAPAGFIAETPDSLEMTLDPRFGTGHATVQRQGDGLELDFEFHQRTGHYPPTDYVAYQDTMNKAVAALERTVEFKADSP